MLDPPLKTRLTSSSSSTEGQGHVQSDMSLSSSSDSSQGRGRRKVCSRQLSSNPLIADPFDSAANIKIAIEDDEGAPHWESKNSPAVYQYYDNVYNGNCDYHEQQQQQTEIKNNVNANGIAIAITTDNDKSYQSDCNAQRKVNANGFAITTDSDKTYPLDCGDQRKVNANGIAIAITTDNDKTYSPDGGGAQRKVKPNSRNHYQGHDNNNKHGRPSQTCDTSESRSTPKINGYDASKQPVKRNSPKLQKSHLPINSILGKQCCGPPGTGRPPKPDYKQYSSYHDNPLLCQHILNKGVRPQVFKDRLAAIKRWFTDFNDEQKNLLLKGLLDGCELPQVHLLSVKMDEKYHLGCPTNCQDIITWLPTNTALKIMSYLDPASLCRASQVCRVWRQHADEPLFWRRFCCQQKWRLSKAAEHKQVICHMSPEGSIQWKKVFAERYRLRNNWLRGRCTVRTFEGHTQGISCVQFDDSRIVSGSSDKTIKVWNIRTNAPWSVQTLVGHSGTVRCLHLDGNRLVSGSTDKTIKVWDLSTQDNWSSIACKVTMIGHTDTVRCLQVDDDKVISGSYDMTLKVWDLRSGQARMTLRGHQAPVLCVHFSETKIVSGSCDKTIKVWNYSGACLMTLTGHQDAVTCLQFDTTRIVSGSLDYNLKFWDVHSGECVNTIDWKAAEGHTGVVRCLQADGWRLVSAADDKTIKVWNLETCQRLITLQNHTDGVTCLQFNDFIIVSGSYDKTVKLWDFSSC